MVRGWHNNRGQYNEPEFFSTPSSQDFTMSKEQDALFVRNFSLVLIFLAAVCIIAFIIAKMISGRFLHSEDTDVAIAERLAPVGSVNIDEPFTMGGNGETQVSPAEPTAAADVAVATPSDAGKAAYGKICFACHDAGVAGAPKLGDAQAWAGRLEKGTEMLVSNAITGFTGDVGMMPPKGGMASLSDDEVRAAVMYQLTAVGAGGDATQAPASETPPAEPATEAAATSAVSDARGNEVYDAACFICHATGVAGAPKLGDSADWAPRIERGADLLYKHAIEGFMGEAGLMPPKGGRMDYSDDDVKAAVDYMVNNSQ